MDPEEQRLGQAALDFLVALVGSCPSFRARIKPASLCPWTLDQQAPLASAAQDFANISLLAADLYLGAVMRWMSSEVDPVSGYTLLRAAGEASSQACWLLDPEVSGETRRDRGLSVRLARVREERKAAQIKDGREEHLQESARAAGVQPRTTKAGKAGGFIDPMPRSTELFEMAVRSTGMKVEEGSGVFAYRYLSSHAHTIPWALLGGAITSPSGKPGTALVSVQFDMAVFVTFLEVVAAIYLAGHTRYAQLQGRLNEWGYLLRRLPRPPRRTQVGDPASQPT